MRQFSIVALLGLTASWFAIDRAFAEASAYVTAGNAESPNGQDFSEGIYAAIAAATDTDPNFGTATGAATVVGPSQTFSGSTAAFAGPAWVASGGTAWNDLLNFYIPVEEVSGNPGDLLVELIGSFEWDIEANGYYTISMQHFGAWYSTSDGLAYDDFGTITPGNSGSALLSILVPFDVIEIDSEDPSYYLGQLDLLLEVDGDAASGDHTHGSFLTASINLSFQLTNINVMEGSSQVAAEIEGDSGFPYEFEETSGDFDQDGDVDGRDFLLWQRGFGITSGAEPIDGDSNGDGDVDGGDLEVWQSQYGWGTLASVSTVPEPASAMLITGLLVLMALRRSRD